MILKGAPALAFSHCTGELFCEKDPACIVELLWGCGIVGWGWGISVLNEAFTVPKPELWPS